MQTNDKIDQKTGKESTDRQAKKPKIKETYGIDKQIQYQDKNKRNYGVIVKK